MHPDQDVDPPRRSSRGMFLILAIAAAVVLFAVLLRQRESSGLGNAPAAVGQHLDSLQLEPLLNADKSVELSDLRGKVTLINIWGPWCGPCLMELPDLTKLEQKYRGQAD